MIAIATFFKVLRASYKEAMARHEVYMRTRKELDSLNHRELMDIGIHAGDIARIARQAADEAIV